MVHKNSEKSSHQSDIVVHDHVSYDKIQMSVCTRSTPIATHPFPTTSFIDTAWPITTSVSTFQLRDQSVL